MDTGLILRVAIGVIAVLLLAYGASIYNSLVQVRNNVGKAWQNIDVVLQQRHDELPKLVDACTGYMKHERDVLDQITRLRMRYSQAPTSEEKTRAENQLNQQMGNLRLTLEAYPDLKASQNFLQLQGRVSGLESSIADRRELFNDSANIYNIMIAQFPAVILARLLRYGPHPLLEIPEERKQDVKMRFA
jgi:LemA protein